MTIHQASRDRVFQSKPSHQTLKPRQILQGRTLKIYPNHKARIQLGNHIMIAQLEARLSWNTNYHFQVQTMDNVVYLKMLGKQLEGNTRRNATRLLRLMDLKGTRTNTDFTQSLISENIPFERGSLLKSFQLLDSVNNKSYAQQVLKEMIANQLPLNDSVFQALYTHRTTGLSKQVNALLELLKHNKNPTPLQKNLMNRLSPLVENRLTSKH